MLLLQLFADCCPNGIACFLNTIMGASYFFSLGMVSFFLNSFPFLVVKIEFFIFCPCSCYIPHPNPLWVVGFPCGKYCVLIGVALLDGFGVLHAWLLQSYVSICDKVFEALRNCILIEIG